jgi:tripartite-type tricarboxylate transporter receptor subunit TctC
MHVPTAFGTRKRGGVMKVVLTLLFVPLVFAHELCAAQAQQKYPTRPVRMVVAFPVGSETDFYARVVAHKLTENWNQQVVVDNRPGAGGTLARSIAAAATADGYTLLVDSMAYAITPAIYRKLPYDTLRDLKGVSQISGVPNVLVVSPATAPKSVKELIALAKQKPKQVTYGSAGVGSGMHINGEQFRLMAGIDVIHVPYKGGPEAVTDTLGGRIHYTFSPIGLALPLVRDGRLVALAVSTAKRSPALPDVPTVAEAGVPGFEYDTWYGLFAPAKAPPAIIARISEEVVHILNLPEIRKRIIAQGGVPRPSPAEQFNRFVRAEVERLGAIVKAAGIKVE